MKKQYLSSPPINKNVLPRQCCPAFTAREGAMPFEKECWFCRYADFHIEKVFTLDVGICGYPDKCQKYMIYNVR